MEARDNGKEGYLYWSAKDLIPRIEDLLQSLLNAKPYGLWNAYVMG